MNKNTSDFRTESFDHPTFFNGSSDFFHPANQASWIWVGNTPTTRFLRFSIEFDAPTSDTLRFHVTADQRFQLRLDGESITYGPDRSDLEHWRVTTCEVPLPQGTHKIEVLAWWINEDLSSVRSGCNLNDTPPANPPMAQMSWRGGFLLAAEGSWASILNTGYGDWKVSDLTEAVEMARKNRLGYHDIGAGFTIDLEQWNAVKENQIPVCVLPPNEENPHGIRRPGWALRGHTLPEQKRARFSGGTFRALRNSFEEQAFTAEEIATPELAIWNKSGTIQIPAHSKVTVIWDLGEYVCGYPKLQWANGAGATIEIEWAESLYEGAHSAEIHANIPKGIRSEILNKAWLGFGDTFVCSGTDKETSPDIWWRSGCFIRLRICTSSQPLALEQLELLTTEYPLNHSDHWSSSDTGWDELFPLLRRGLELCAHETWVDCPYYEQLMYVGDTRLHNLSNYACYPDDRLSRSAIEQFDASRSGSLEGFVAERYPSSWRQDSPTFALIWVWMVRDFMLWRNDATFVQIRLVSVRQMLERFLSMRQKNGLLGSLPGWPFVDWDLQWKDGCGEGVREGDSSIVNLHMILSLQAAAELETAVGETVMAERWNALAQGMMQAVLERYWDHTKSVVLDTPNGTLISEHAQALALLTGLLDPHKSQGCMTALQSGTCGAKCSIYFSFYLLEAFAQTNEADAFFNALDFWRHLPAQGFKSLPESPGNNRSDCHGWGAHPLYHSYASIAGIRPAAPGFQKVRIAPMLGHLESLTLEMPHPNGTIQFSTKKKIDGFLFTIHLPEGISGELVWEGKTIPLKQSQTINLKNGVVNFTVDTRLEA